MNAAADISAKRAARPTEDDVFPTLRNHHLAKDSGQHILARQGPLPGAVHSYVLGDARKTVEDQRRAAALEYWKDCEKQGRAWHMPNASVKLTEAALAKLPTDVFFTKLLTRNLPTMHKLVRNYHVDGHNHSMRCAVCGEADEYTDHIYTCAGNVTGRGLTLAAIADIIADEYTTADGPTDISDWMPESAIEKVAANRQIQRMQILQLTGKKPPRIALEGGHGTKQAGRPSLQAYAARMQAERKGKRPNTCRETTAWEYTTSWQRPWSELATELESMEHDNAEIVPHGLMRILQGNIHFDTQVTDRYIGAYPGAAVHTRCENWRVSDDATGTNDNTIITLSTPPTADVLKHMEEMGALIAHSTKAKRLTALIPNMNRWTETTATRIVEFDRNTLPVTESMYHRGDTSDTTPSRHTWQLLIWENHAAKATWPLTTALERQVTRWLKQHARTAKDEAHTVPMGLWNPGVNKGRKAKYGWEYAPTPTRSQHRATAWRLLPLTLLGWIDTTPFMTDNEQKIYAAALNAAGKAWENETVEAMPLPTECDIMRGIIPLEAAERLGHHLKISNNSKSGETTAAETLAIKIAMTAMRSTKQILWKHRNKLHHEQVQSADREDLKWLRNLKRGHKAGDTNVAESDTAAPQVTTTIRKMTNFYPQTNNKAGAVNITLPPGPPPQPEETETPARSSTDTPASVKRKAGRPKGSRNKPKLTETRDDSTATTVAQPANTAHKRQKPETDKGQGRLTAWLQPRKATTAVRDDAKRETAKAETAAKTPPTIKQTPTDRPPPQPDPPAPAPCKGKGARSNACNCKHCKQT
jgi:hypothetical protein